MKKFTSLISVALVFLPYLQVWASNELDAAWVLSYHGIITAQDDYSDYRVENTITRREMLKIMMNISGKSIPNSCGSIHSFNDLDSSDWGCKYADAAIKAWYIAKNDSYRPDDNISQVEALKMIMKAKDIEREENSNWKLGYVNTAYEQWILESKFTNYDTAALRGWIFIIVQDAIIEDSSDTGNILDILINQ